MKFYKHIINNILSLIFPNHCIICGELMQSNNMNYVCIDCINKNLDYIHKDEYIRCNKCGKVLESEKSICICKDEELYFDECKSMLYYNNHTIDLIHKMKFSHRYLICKDFAAMLSYYYKDYIKSYDAITFVPLGKNRFLERGYNQSEIIAETISKILNIKLIDDIIFRQKETKALSSLNSKIERLNMIKNAFVINNDYSDYNKINLLIIDDVLTTGSTLNEISKEIKKLECVKKIGLLTVARA
ncbi:ComF family protein [Brachyspira hyodysenteriae]|uniref:ComF family protein n=1 Tax=Brachyspira hyodysenteriae TaxID=159 RepID=UPI001ADD6567|nr:ComF family protein [Brachyspira hyodysenteriae]MCZ9889119.1 ComF family protein [Brachyspira hyodysenteriae]MCZ9919248.1 ComF family protein [Brachyspira hyodysenteriae]MCZ9963962.1 ComF family protein [Brachyspira hyodysenteriae]MDA0023402.1 ComF family protein [Brachyspira hyodysenteriae]MDA0043269.1 ComF family protein [Brachyspira hyodysenteriae]